MSFSQTFCQSFTNDHLMLIQQHFYVQSSTENGDIDYAMAIFEDAEGVNQTIEIVASTDSDQTNMVIYLIDALGMSETINLEKMLNIIALAKIKPLPSIVVD